MRYLEVSGVFIGWGFGFSWDVSVCFAPVVFVTYSCCE